MSAAIPNRAVFRAQEVCEIADVQPYVLRSWEAEFPDLGVARTPAGPRVYRRADVERVLRLKHLLFVDGLTLAGARKQLQQEGAAAAPADEAISDADMAAMLNQQTRDSLRELRGGLEWILGVLNGRQGAADAPAEFALRAQPAATPTRTAKKAGVVKGRTKRSGKSKK